MVTVFSFKQEPLAGQDMGEERNCLLVYESVIFYSKHFMNTPRCIMSDRSDSVVTQMVSAAKAIF